MNSDVTVASSLSRGSTQSRIPAGRTWEVDVKELKFGGECGALSENMVFIVVSFLD